MVAIEKFDILSNISSTRKVKNHGHGYGVRNDLSWLSLDNYDLIQPMNSCLSTLHGRANSFDPMTNGFSFGRDFELVLEPLTFLNSSSFSFFSRPLRPPGPAQAAQTALLAKVAALITALGDKTRAVSPFVVGRLRAVYCVCWEGNDKGVVEESGRDGRKGCETEGNDKDNRVEES